MTNQIPEAREPELLPCFCRTSRNDNASLSVRQHMDHGDYGCRSRGFFVVCSNCWARGPAASIETDARKYWNDHHTRANGVSTPKVLTDCQSAIASLPEDALGHDPQGGWFYRDELLSNIDKAIAAGGVSTANPATGATDAPSLTREEALALVEHHKDGLGILALDGLDEEYTARENRIDELLRLAGKGNE